MRRNNIVLAVMAMILAPAVFGVPLSGNGPVWDAPLLFEDAGNYAPFRADAWPGPLARTVEVDASVISGPFAFDVNGRRVWKTGDFVDGEAGSAVVPRFTATDVFRFYSTDSDALSTVVTNGREVVGYFETPGARWALYPLAGKTHLLVRDDEVPFNCVAANALATSSKRRSASSGSSDVNLEVVQLGIGFWYNPRFAETVGGDDKAKLLLQLFADTENTALIETGNTYARVVLVTGESVGVAGVGGAGETDYAAARTVEDGLHRFYKDPVIRRKRYDRKISIAGYFDAVSDISTGLASTFWGKPNSASGTFAVFWGKTLSLGAVVHEIGHTMGLHHDVSNGAPANAHKGTLGFVNCRDEVRCVMSGAPCFTRGQLSYSNPARIVARAPFGSEASNAAGVIRGYRFIIRDDFPMHAIDGDM